MRNWSVNEKKLKKYPLECQRWWHEQALNFGLKKGEKLDVNFLRENIENLNVEESSREYVKFLLKDEDIYLAQAEDEKNLKKITKVLQEVRKSAWNK